jgi:hypothetical protein
VIVSQAKSVEYVLYRARIIEKLKTMAPKDGEDAIHKIIVPMLRTFYSESWVEDAYTNNVWLLDDKYVRGRTEVESLIAYRRKNKLTVAGDARGHCEFICRSNLPWRPRWLWPASC